MKSLHVIETDPETGLDRIIEVDPDNVRPLNGFLAGSEDEPSEDARPWLRTLIHRDPFLRSKGWQARIVPIEALPAPVIDIEDRAVHPRGHRAKSAIDIERRRAANAAAKELAPC